MVLHLALVYNFHMKSIKILIIFFTFCIFFLTPSSALADTLYFNDATEDGDWATLENWWTDAGFTEQALELPGASDDVQIHQSVYDNSDTTPTVNSMSLFVNTELAIDVIVTNGATFNSNSYISGTIEGDVIFNDNGWIDGGTIDGDATLNTSLYGESAPTGGVFILDDYEWTGNITGTVYGSDSMEIATYIFENSMFNSGTINGNAIFKDTTSNSGTINGNACFSPTATNSGTVTGTVSVCSAPIITTSAASSVTKTSATLNASITNLGGGNVFQHGFVYGTDPLLTTVIATSTLGVKSTTGSFVVDITSLSCDTKYYFRPYSSNTIGTSTGTIIDFTTSPCVSSGGGGSSSSAGYSTGGGVIAINTPPAVNTTVVCNLGQIFSTATGQRCTEFTNNTDIVPSDTNSNISKLNFNRDLTIGSRGDDVVKLQNLLISLNLLDSTNNTGYFGPITRSSLIKYQQANNITPAEGYFGEITRALIKDSNLVLPTSNITNILSPANLSNQPVGTFYRDLKIGMSGEDVKQLQIFLQSTGHLNLGTLSPTTYFGPITRQALIKYQLEQGITPAEGYFGAITRDRIGR